MLKCTLIALAICLGFGSALLAQSFPGYPPANNLSVGQGTSSPPAWLPLGSTLNTTGNAVNVTTCTAGQLGACKPDGTTITATGGTLTAIGGAATNINAAGPTSGTTISNGGNNKLLVDSNSAGTDYVTGTTPASFWDNFCGNTIGFVWARLSGGWACSPTFDAPVTWWGASCNGSTNDTTAINNAIASGIKSILIPATCNVTTLTQLPTNLTLHGQNTSSSCIQTTSATGDVITASNGDTIRDLCFTSTVTRTAGDMIHIGGGTNITNVANVFLNRLYVTNYFNGIELNNAQLIRGTDILMAGQSWSHDGILIDGASGVAQPYNTDIHFSGVVITSGTNGVDVKSDGDVRFFGLQVFNASSDGIFLDPSGAAASGNNIQYFLCSGCLLDSNGANGLGANASNGAGIYTLKIVDSWIATNSLWGIGLLTDTGNGSAINESDIVNNLIANNTFYGIVLDDNSAVAGTNILGNSIAQNGIGHSGGGIYVGTGSNSFRIIGNKIGAASEFTANNLSVNCSGSATPNEVIATDNDMLGQASSCSWTFTVKANNINF